MGKEHVETELFQLMVHQRGQYRIPFPRFRVHRLGTDAPGQFQERGALLRGVAAVVVRAKDLYHSERSEMAKPPDRAIRIGRTVSEVTVCRVIV